MHEPGRYNDTSPTPCDVAFDQALNTNGKVDRIDHLPFCT
jgi:hypothetical protein